MSLRPAAFALVLAAMSCARAPARSLELREGVPEEVGMVSERLERAARMLEDETRSGRVPAASILVARHGVVVLDRGSGRLSPGPSGAPAGPRTVYIVASVTKPVAVTALMLLVDRGRVALSEPVQKYLPGFEGALKDTVLVKDLLSHVSGLPDMLPEDRDLRRANAPLGSFVKAALATPLVRPPRTAFLYSSMGILLAGYIVERQTGMPLRLFMKRELFDPLGMGSSSLGLGGRRLEETAMCRGIATSFKDPQDEGRFGANTPYWRDMGHPWGGLHSTTRDLGLFLQLFLNEGEYGGKRILAAATARSMTTDQNGGQAAPWGWGWGLQRSDRANPFGERASERTFGHSGASGTLVWADPDRDLLCVILTSRAWSEDGGSLLRKVSDLVQAAVED